MIASNFNIFIFFAIISTVYCSSCNNPTVTSKSFTTQDATIVTNIAYVAEFDLKCDSGAPSSLYADIDGNITPASLVTQNGYQVYKINYIKSIFIMYLY